MCAWTFGNTKLLTNGSIYNVIFCTHPYLIQRIWDNARGGYCALALDEEVPVESDSRRQGRAVVPSFSREGVLPTWVKFSRAVRPLALAPHSTRLAPDLAHVPHAARTHLDSPALRTLTSQLFY